MACCCGPAPTSCTQCCGYGCEGSQYSDVSCNSIYATFRVTYASQTVRYKFYSCLDIEDTFSFASSTVTRLLGCSATNINFAADETKRRNSFVVSCPTCIPYGLDGIADHVLSYQLSCSIAIALVNGACVATLSASNSPQGVQSSFGVLAGGRSGSIGAIVSVPSASASKTIVCASDLVGLSVSPSMATVTKSCCAGACNVSNVDVTFSTSNPFTVTIESVSLLP